MRYTHRSSTWCLAAILSAAAILAAAGPLSAQPADFANRPVSAVKVEGLKQVKPALVENQLRLAKGDPYSAAVVGEDIVRITHLGRFGAVTARVDPLPDGTVEVTYMVQELAMLADVIVVGNKAISDQELLKLAAIRTGDPVDPFLIQRAIAQIKQAYEKQGYFQADVSLDQAQLDESGVLILRVREGGLARLRDIRFEGNTLFDDDQLYGQIKSRTYLWILRKGEVNREALEQDAARLRDFYRDAGYLEAQVGRRLDISDDQEAAVVTFVVSEGRLHTVDKITVQGNELFSTQQILQAMSIRPGDVFTAEKVKQSYDAVIDLYGKLGFIETRIEQTAGGQAGFERVFHEDKPQVDLIVKIREGKPYTVGKVMVSGNAGTQDKVILRQVRGLEPGRRFDRSGIELTEKRLSETPLFSDANVTVLGDSNTETRDVVVEVKEKQTGSLTFGAGISSDSGVLGSVELTQRNFDIADWPDSWGEYFSGRGFVGAGQYFNLAIQPGNEASRYAIAFREPSLLETNLFLDTNLFYTTRDRDEYAEGRAGAGLGLGQRFGDVWSASLRARGESIEIDDIVTDAAQDIFDVGGSNTLTALSFSVTRNTTDSSLFPTKGSLLELSLTRAGALGGDYDFSRIELEFRKFWTVDQDFFGYKTILTFRGNVGYILEEMDQVPLFERLYAGGRSFRGFSYRGIGPLGLKHNSLTQYTDDHVGGQWLFLAGLEYNFPIYEDMFRGVVFTDTGTVANDVGFEGYRVSIGAGIRLKIPFLGQAPFALDFAVPLVKQDGDDTRIFSFDISLPFR